MNKLEPCPFCGNPHPIHIRYKVGTHLIHPYGDMFCIVCDCGCMFEVHQDELFDEVESQRDAMGRYEDIISDDDLWDVLFSRWNRRFETKLKDSMRRHKESIDKLAEDDRTANSWALGKVNMNNEKITQQEIKDIAESFKKFKEWKRGENMTDFATRTFKCPACGNTEFYCYPQTAVVGEEKHDWEYTCTKCRCAIVLWTKDWRKKNDD